MTDAIQIKPLRDQTESQCERNQPEPAAAEETASQDNYWSARLERLREIFPEPLKGPSCSELLLEARGDR